MTKILVAAHRHADQCMIGAALAAFVVSAPIFAFYIFSNDVRQTPPVSKAPSAAELQAQQAEVQRLAEIGCLAEAMYFEAVGEGTSGQKAVAEVVLQRTKDKHYPRTICAVVYQGVKAHRRTGCQFSFACDGSTRRPKQARAWQRTQELAEKIYNGTVKLSQTDRAIAFHNLNVLPAWADTMVRTAQIGNHIFYRRAPFGVTQVNAPVVEEVTPRSGILTPEGIVIPLAEAAKEAVENAAEALAPDSGA